MRHSYHLEKHYIERAGWLRAAVLGQMTELFQSPVWWWVSQPVEHPRKFYW